MHYTVSAIATLLSISEEQILAHIKAGRLKAVNVGSGTVKPRWRISQAHLDAFLESRTATAPVPQARRRKSADNVIAFYP